jgi:alkanesulfonate monooxygenase SsuD/methylene tetrahydromethanopterin reductase-like flavin-dependent oxidoreductase (luciferase family)
MPRPLRVGVQLPEVERQVAFAEHAAIARAAEEIGIDSLWAGDHLLYRDDGREERGPHEVWTLLAGIAAVTERVTIGPLVACTAFHPPTVLAKMAATISDISDGRFILGLGSGWNEQEFNAFGLPFDRRVSRFEEAFAIIRPLAAGERVTLEGRYASADDAVLLPPPAHRIPLLAGVGGPRALAITLPHVDWWNTWYLDYRNTPEGFAVRNREIDEAARAAGRDPASLLRSACVYVRFGGGAGGRPKDEGITPADGEPEALAAHLRALAAAGADEAILVLDPIEEATVRRLAPVLAALDAG